MNYQRAKEISDITRKAVLDRQRGRSISGAYLNEDTASFHHFIPRSASGLGYEWNIVALTFDEHRAVHDHQPIKVNGRDRYTHEEFCTLMRNHLIMNYSGWMESKCKYKKGWDEEDYEVHRLYIRK